jgi:hypothetical protein
VTSIVKKNMEKHGILRAISIPIVIHHPGITDQNLATPVSQLASQVEHMRMMKPAFWAIFMIWSSLPSCQSR